MTRHRQFVALTLALLATPTLGCAHQAYLCRASDETYPTAPFTLEVRLPVLSARAGEKLQAEYTLTNTSNQAVSACIVGRGDYEFGGEVGGGRVTTLKTHGLVFRDEVFRLPPHTALTWKVDVEVFALRPGDADFSGFVHSSCPLWTGTVSSRPIPFVVREPNHEPPNKP